MTFFGLLRIPAVEFLTNRPSTSGLMYRTRPGFIPRPLLPKIELSDRLARSVEMFLADSIVAGRLEDFTVVETSRAHGGGGSSTGASRGGHR